MILRNDIAQRELAIVIVGAMMVGAAYACNSTTVANDGGSDSSDSSDSPVEAACQWMDNCVRACVIANCCSQENACSMNADCVAYGECEGECSLGDSSTCISGCADAHPQGAALSQSAANCIEQNCSDACAP